MTSFVENHFMIINENGAYPIKEASDLTGINPRTLSRLAKKLGIEKIDNRYIFKGSDLITHLKKIEVEVGKYDDILKEIATLETSNYRLSQQVETMSRTVKKMEDSIKILNEHNLELNQIIKEKDGVYALKSDEVHKLKQKLVERTAYLTSDIPHKEKLKEAIRLITIEAMEQGVTHKIFSEDEYDDIVGTMAEVNFQTKQVEYLKGRVEKQDEMLQEISAQIRQRNFIEAKEKGLDKK
jgi:DNA-binding transcriptional MerR regulator